MKQDKKIKVLIVDDSELVRDLLDKILSDDSLFLVVGKAADPYEAAKLITIQVPDVITLDIEMPRMNGLTFLKKIMMQHPIPVVVVSSYTGDRTDIAVRALSLGAAEIVTKPKLNSPDVINEYSIKLKDAIRAASCQDMRRYSVLKEQRNLIKHKKDGGVPFDIAEKRLILIGASTGGTILISQLLKVLRNDLPPILIVQHMPGEFTSAFAKRLDSECALVVKEASHHEVLKRGHVYIANGFYHMVVKKAANHYVCDLIEGELVNRHRPSVDVLFNSVAQIASEKTMAILLTGMGADGANGLLKLRNNGAICIAQDEKTSAVFGMPREAAKLNAANLIGSPEMIVKWINNFI